MWSVKHYNLMAIVLLYCYQITESAYLRCYKGSLNNSIAVPLESNPSQEFIDCIDKNLPTKFYTFGYRGRRLGPATTAVLSSFIETKKRNVILVDWEKEAESGMLGIALGYALSAVPNARKIGQRLGDVLIYLNKAGLNITNNHLVGHSLGAHLMGYAGRAVREQGYVVPRITGLDPARALFEGAFAVKTGLDRTCAKFVDIIHSDPGGYGTTGSDGSVDLWPNYKGKKSTQPGCEEGEFEAFSREDLCKHDRSWMYYAEAVSSPTSFPAVHAKNPEEWVAQNVDFNKTVLLGELTNTRARGNYYLSTNGKPPYGRGVAGLVPSGNESRTDTESTTTSILNTIF